MKKFFLPIGWSMGINRWHDETGMFHLTSLYPGKIQCHNACGTQSLTSGQCEKKVENRGQHCQKCLSSAIKLFKSIDKWNVEQCYLTMLTLNRESRNKDEIEKNLDFYREHCRCVFRDYVGLKTKISKIDTQLSVTSQKGIDNEPKGRLS